ncbi:hypothetical protein HMPREF9088_1392 [Enterococcus italicus DSM 15952]|uniref:SGNH hydrolase-type esterase domain-containing protein n=2 Tax=Enterococcus italicus TaxID=246144 RepID=E6LGA2_ENTI1|nr:hypothetical protein HMPREF9088_1392 [Enterococcus italicus DSM 15952]
MIYSNHNRKRFNRGEKMKKKSKENWVAFGDSITWYHGQKFLDFTKEPGVKVNGYQYYLEKELGITVKNEGVSGDTIQQICQRSLRFDFSDFSGVLYFGGVNNFNKMPDSTFGKIEEIDSDFNEETFCGAYQKMLEDVIVRYPEKRIILIIPYKVYKKELGIMPEKFPQTIKKIASLYSLSCCDLYFESGFNILNFSTYFVDDDEKVGYYFHLNNLGYEKISQNLISFLKPFIKEDE